MSAAPIRPPRWAHVPGTTRGADLEPLEAAKATVQGRLEIPTTAHPAVGYGLTLYDRGFFWEAHEVLEAAWMATPPNSRGRAALRAVIQLANAGLKLRMGRPRAAARLLREVLDILPELSGSASGAAPDSDIALADALGRLDLKPRIDACLSNLEAGASRVSAPSLRCMKMHAADGERWTAA